MINKIFLLLKRVIFATVLIYSYDLVFFSSINSIPINYFTILIVSLFDFIRPEIKFESTDLLIEQIKKDIKKMSD